MTNALAHDANYLREVRRHYEHYPYPPRDPADEKVRFHSISTCALDCMNYYHFSGKRDFTKNFRALVAGGGTGDATITLAEQLRDSQAEIIHLDISTASMQVAQERAKVRALTNIQWVHGSLLDAPKLLDGHFDYINCSGVLHHLELPETGLAALTKVLAEEGVIDLMLYAIYGRESVYQLQTLMRIFNRDEDDLQKKIDNCKAVIGQLPGDHPFHELNSKIDDVRKFGDAGLYDLLLHSNDVAYSVPQVYRFLETAGLQLTHLFFSGYPKGNQLYKFESYIGDGSLTDVIPTLTTQQNQAAAELMNGQIIKHEFYASRIKPIVPGFDNLNNVPYYSVLFQDDFYEAIGNSVKKFPIDQPVVFTIEGKQVRFKNMPSVPQLLHFMDGKRSLGEIYKLVQTNFKNAADNNRLTEEFQHVFSAFNQFDFMYLRDKSAPPVKSLWHIPNPQ